MGSSRRSVIAAILVGPGAFATTSAAYAQNTDAYFFSDDAAIMAGAVVARPGDAAGVWYNAASLGAVTRPRMMVNGSVFGVRFRNHPDALVTDFGESANRLALDSTTYVATPTGVTAAFSVLPWLTIGGGLYTTARDIEDATDDDVTSINDAMGTTQLTQRIHYQIDRKKMVAGGAFGIRVTDDFRIGSAMFGTYTTANVKAELSNEIQTGDPLSEIIVIDVDGSVTAFGLLPTLGFQWDLSDAIHLGANIVFPEIMLTASSKGGSATIVVSRAEGSPSGDLAFESTEGSGDAEALSPPKFSVGATFDVARGVEIGMGVDATTGLTNDAFGLDKKGIVNVRAGVRVQVIPELALGGGAFTDFANDSRLNTGLGERRLDFIGGTLGGSLMTPIVVVDRSDPIIIATTVAVRYAVGFGEGRTLRFSDGGTIAGTVDILAHDLMPYLGTSISL